MRAYDLLFTAALEGAPDVPNPPVTGTATTTPSISCVGVTYDQLLGALAALKTDILNVVATNVALQSAKNEILAAIEDISCGSTVTPAPDPNAGYAMVGTVKYTDLRQAALAVPDGGVVEIYGEMRDLNGSAGFLNGCTIRGMTPDAKLNWTLGTSERMAFGKGLIVCAGAGKTYLVENLELCGARVTDANGAGVRGDGAASVTVQNCNIHDNENGVLSVAANQFYYGNTFSNNGVSSGQAHNVYAGTGAEQVIAEGNTFNAAIAGNQFKSRAKQTVFRRNRVAELAGACSWQVDIPNGGDVLIEKNVIEQGPNASNRNMISYGPEGLPADGRVNALVFNDNWVINDHALDAWGLNIFNAPSTLEIARNTFVGQFAAYVQNGTMDTTNLTHADRAAAGLAAYPALPEVPAP
jgi:hypothetical protein